MIAGGRASRLRRTALWLAVAVVAAWGLRLNILEGFVYEWPRHFRGDFHEALFGAWDVHGASYGPLFVIEHWLLLSAPGIFNEYFFALLNVPIVAVAFFLTSRAARLTPFTILVATAAWLCYRWLPYSFSVSANPELAEMALLSLAWYGASRHRVALGAAAVTGAAMIKRIPIIFLPVVLMTEGLKRSTLVAMAVAAAFATGMLVIVGVGQGVNPIDVAWRTLVAASVTDVLAQPFPYPSQFVGFSNAMARLFARPIDDWSLPFFQGYYYVVLASALGYALFIAHGLLRRPGRLDETRAKTVVYGIFFALLPMAAVNTHPHTFIFLLPTFTAVIALIAGEPHRSIRRWMALVAAISFLFIGFPALVTPIDRVLHTHLYAATLFQDPIWLNVVLLLGMFAYATAMLHRPLTGDQQNTEHAAVEPALLGDGAR